MIEAGLEFQGDLDGVLRAFVTLPARERPLYFSETEDGSAADRLSDQVRFAMWAENHKDGFFLLAPGLAYNIRVADGKPILCDCFLHAEPAVAREFLEHMASASPTFGFACAPEERAHRNRVTYRSSSGSVDAWVGRDTQRYLPGLYWLTLLSPALAERHALALDAIVTVAEEASTAGAGLHLFQLFQRPEQWRAFADRIDRLCASQAGVFDVSKVRPLVTAARSFLELTDLLADWR